MKTTKLKKCTKEEILYALENSCSVDEHTIGTLSLCIEQKRLQDRCDNFQKAKEEYRSFIEITKKQYGENCFDEVEELESERRTKFKKLWRKCRKI